ncbi:MAG: hypothetical protein WCR06_09075, partial [bacterium]
MNSVSQSDDARTQLPLFRRICCVFLFCVAASLVSRAANDDLVIARNAVHDKLYDVAVTHA